MTIPKNAGLSRLAASPIEYYPVKRRGQKRRLTPNWDAINWLERETETDCEISDVSPLFDGMYQITALGWFSAKRRGMYSRRMFDIFELEASSTHLVAYPKPCPDCLDFSRTWACTEHPEVAWDTKRRVWVRPGTPIWYELHPEDRPDELAPRRSILDALPDVSVTLTGTFTLEITSDTTEASARSVRIEVERDGDTTP